MIEDEYEQSVLPVAALAGESIAFEIPGEPNVYRDLSNSYLEIECKITKSNGTNLDANSAVAPVNLLLHSLFSHVEVKICGQVITDKESLYHYRAFFETLLEYSSETLQMRESLAGWSLEATPDKLDNLLLATAENVTPNPAFVERAKWCATSKTMTFVGRPHADVFHQDLDIPAGCDIHVKMTRNPTSLCIMAAEDATFKLTITAATLHVKSKRCATDVVLSHRHMLEKTSFPHAAHEGRDEDVRNQRGCNQTFAEQHFQRQQHVSEAHDHRSDRERTKVWQKSFEPIPVQKPQSNRDQREGRCSSSTTQCAEDELRESTW